METIQPNGSERWEKSYCPYCGVGCGLLAKIRGGAVTRIKGDPNHPSSLGDLCLKAIYLPEVIQTHDRLVYPQLRQCQDSPFKRVSWQQVMTYLAKRFRAIIDEHGPDAVAFYGSGQLTTEEYYVANKLAKGFLGTNNFDTNSRLCMASAVAGYKTSLGSDGPPNSYADIDEANCLLLIGTNTADCHPVIFKRIKKRKQSDPKRVTVISVDPRRTETADFADLHLPLKPGSDVALLNSMLWVLIQENLIDSRIRCPTHQWFSRAQGNRREISAEGSRRDLRRAGVSDRRSGVDIRHGAKRAHALEHGRESELRRRAEEQCDYQSPPC